MDQQMQMTMDKSQKSLAMAYVPRQSFGQVYEPMQALKAGTVFPELNKPFTGRRGVRR